MASDIIKCPYCECKVRISDIEKEDGICPECGQFVLAPGLGGESEGDDEDLNVMDGEYENDDDGWNTTDDTEEPDILDELNEDFEAIDEDGAPRTRRRRSAGVGFQAPQTSSTSKKTPKGGRKK